MLRLILVICAIVIIGLPAGFFLILAGGPKAFLPPLTYDVEVELVLSINGVERRQRQGFNCRVRDQRNSIANSDFAIGSVGENPFFLTPDGGAVVLSGLKPCPWVEEPQPGERVEIIPLSLRQPFRERPDLEEGERYVSSAYLVVLSDTDRPSTLRLIPLEDIVAHPVLGIRLLALSVTETKGGGSENLAEAVPFFEIIDLSTADLSVAEREELFLSGRVDALSARVFSVSRMSRCQYLTDFPEDYGFYELENGNTCLGDLLRNAEIHIRGSLPRFEIIMEPMRFAPWAIGFTLERLVREVGGNFQTSGDHWGGSFRWTAQICVDQWCFEQPVGGILHSVGYYDPRRQEILQINTYLTSNYGLLRHLDKR